MENQSIAKNLLYQRKLKGYSQDKLSEATGVTVRTIQRIEKGEVNPHLETIKLLADGLNIQTDDLLVLENPKEESLQMKWLLTMHGVPIIGLMIPFFNILVSIFLWIHKREDNAIYDRHGRKIINFQITVTLLYALSFVALLTIEGWGFLFFISVIPFSLIVMLANIVYVLKAQKCFYPLAIPVFRNKRAFVTGIGILFFAFSIIGCQNSPEPSITRLDASTITTDSLTSKIKQLVTDGNVHGLAITVFEDNEISYQKAFGFKDFPNQLPLTDSTNIYGASLSKAVFGVLVMQLVQDSLIELDTPLESYLPKKIYEYEPLTKWHDDYSALEKDTLYHKITARMCLSHTSGFPNWRWFEPDQTLRVKFEPGSRYSYSGEGLVYLQVVLEKMLNKGLEEIAQERIFMPLEMTNTSYEWKDQFAKDFAYGHQASGATYEKDTDNEPRSASTLETTAGDYNKFILALLKGNLINQRAEKELFKPQIKIKSLAQFGPLSRKDSTLNDQIQLAYGLGWGLLQTPYGFGAFKEGHGDGFQHYSIIFPETGKGVIIMTISDNGESIFKELLEVTIKDVYTPWKWQNYIPYDYAGM